LKAAVNYLAGSPLQATLDVMLDRSGNLFTSSRVQVAAASAAMLMLAADVAWPQAASPPSAPASSAVQAPVQPAAPDPASPQGAPPSSSPPPAPRENPGFLNEIGKWFEKSLSILPPMKSPHETIDDLNARAKDAGEALSRMARPASWVTGRVICPVSANGTPDCKAASDSLCQGKGFKEGKSLSSESAETCSAKILIPGRARKPDDCRTHHYVTRALCQ
jgi:hypothetical protein